MTERLEVHGGYLALSTPAVVRLSEMLILSGWHVLPALDRAATSGRRPISAPPPTIRRLPAPPRRRRGRGFLRFLKVLLSVLTMIVVPVVALVLAYGYGNGQSIVEDARDVATDIGRFLGL